MTGRSTTMSRRQWLRLAAGGALASLVSARSTRADGQRPVRLILLMQANGTTQVPGKFWPDASGTSPILAPILQHARLRERTVVIKGLSNADGGAGNQHDMGFAGLYTGCPTIGTFDDPWGAAPSIDQILRSDVEGLVPFPTLNCGVLGLDTALLKDHRRSFSYVGPRMQIPTEDDALRLWSTLFGASGDPAEVERQLASRKSVLDYAASDLTRMSTNLGKEERDKLDVHATAIREYEQRLTMLASRPDPAGRCAPPARPRYGVSAEREASVPVLLPMMIDLVALAVACDLTRIVTFPVGSAGLTWRFDWIGIGKDSHGEIAHKDDGKTPAITDAIVKIGAWHAEHVARLALALDAMPSVDGRTVLDDTLIVWGNELATGQHGLDHIPVVMIGRAGGRLTKAGVVDVGSQPYQRLGCTIMNLMGRPVTGFGQASSCGPVRGLNVAG
jgi:hypothetical protein